MFLLNYFLGVPKERQRSILGGFGRLFERPLGSPFGHVGASEALLGHRLGPTWSQKRQDEGLLGSSKGGQGVSEALRVRF